MTGEGQRTEVVSWEVSYGLLLSVSSRLSAETHKELLLKGPAWLWWSCVELAGNLRRVVLDVLKPFEPNIVVMAQNVAEVNGVEGVNITVFQIDREVENIKITVEGRGITYSDLIEGVEEMGGAIHSIDEVAAGKTLIEDVDTRQWELWEKPQLK